MRKVTKRQVSFVLFFAFVTAGAAAQSYTRGQGPSSPGPPGGSSGYLTYEAQSTSRYTQAAVLDQIDGILTSRSHPPSKAERATALRALTDIAESGTLRPAISGTTVINNFPLIRMKACHLIGAMGGPKAESVLLRILKADPDPIVLAETAYELGRIDLNPNDMVSDDIARALIRSVSAKNARVFDYTALLSLKRLAIAGPRQPDPSVFEAVSLIQDMGYGYAVDRSASEALQSLITYG